MPEQAISTDSILVCMRLQNGLRIGGLAAMKQQLRATDEGLIGHAQRSELAAFDDDECGCHQRQNQRQLAGRSAQLHQAQCLVNRVLGGCHALVP